MSYDNGTIAIWRKFLDWEWYEDVNTKALFLHLLLTANWKDKKWKGRAIKRGQRWASRGTLAKETGLSERKIRTALEHLEATGEITIKSTSEGTLITVEKYSDYQITPKESVQHSDQPKGQQETNDRPQLNKDNKENKIESRIDNTEIYNEIVSYLNEKAGTDFKPTTKATREHINARLADGFTVSDFKSVIDNMCRIWKDDEKMVRYLRPLTLFATKFESYLNEKPKAGQKGPAFKEIN